MSVTVTTQAELDKALADKAATIYIESPDGVWLTVRDSGSSHVEAWGSSHVVAWDSSHVVAGGSSHVVAWDSSHVVAWGSSHVVAWGSSHVVAGTHVAVHLHSQRVTLSGGVVIDLTALDLTDPVAWCGYHGVTVGDGKATLYKAVRDDWQTDRGPQWTYAPGTTVVAEDFAPTLKCGQGLHLCPSPSGSRRYFTDATRYVAVSVALDTLVPLKDKAKVPSCVVLHEVDVYGKPVQA